MRTVHIIIISRNLIISQIKTTKHTYQERPGLHNKMQEIECLPISPDLQKKNLGEPWNRALSVKSCFIVNLFLFISKCTALFVRFFSSSFFLQTILKHWKWVKFNQTRRYDRVSFSRSYNFYHHTELRRISLKQP